MIDNFFEYIEYYLLWLVLHESAHICTALIFHLKIRGIGLRIKPMPHIYVEIDSVIPPFQKIFFTLAGVSITALLWAYFYFTNCTNQILVITLTLQLVMDTNPFYSDVQVLNSMLQIKNRSSIRVSYLFSNIGLVHFSTWALIVIFTVYHIKNVLI